MASNDPARAAYVDDYDAPIYVISIAAELADMHPQTLRAYERKGLIEPSRTEGNTRRYSRRDVDKLKFIQHLTQEQGLNIAGVKAVLEMGQKLERARDRIGELEDMVRHLASRLETDVKAAHDSHRFEIIPAPSRQMEVHPRLRRRPPSERRVANG
jgi:MerR family transcriptional regulator/heat shock protein HspR